MGACSHQMGMLGNRVLYENGRTPFPADWSFSISSSVAHGNEELTNGQRHVNYDFQSTVPPVYKVCPLLMEGQTTTPHYLDLTQNQYRQSFCVKSLGGKLISTPHGIYLKARSQRVTNNETFLSYIFPVEDQLSSVRKRRTTKTDPARDGQGLQSSERGKKSSQLVNLVTSL